MADSHIRLLSSEERQGLAVARANEWRGNLSVEQFVARNRILYGGEFGEKRIRSYGLFVDGSALPAASCDFFEGVCYTAQGKQQTQILASALTLPEFQKRGLMSKLLKHAFAELPGTGYLYSDIGPDFYRRFGFVEDTWEEVIETVQSTIGDAEGWQETSKKEFVAAMESHRKQRVASKACDVAFIPDAGWVDWVEQKYAYYTTLSRDGSSAYGQLETSSGAIPTAMFADCLNRRVDILWADPEHAKNWRSIAHALAVKHDLKTIRYWGRGQGGRKTWPMFNPSPRKLTSHQPQSALRLDLNLGDWW